MFIYWIIFFRYKASSKKQEGSQIPRAWQIYANGREDPHEGTVGKVAKRNQSNRQEDWYQFRDEISFNRPQVRGAQRGCTQHRLVGFCDSKERL